KLTITTSLDNVLGTRASTIVGSSATNSAIDLEALKNGAAANGYTVQFIDDGTVNPGGETVSVSGTSIIVDIKNGASTAAQVVSALNNDPTVSALFHAQLDPDDSDGKGAIALAATGTTAGGSGIQLDQSSGLQITSGGVTTTLDISSAKTVQDLLNLITASGTGLIAQINSAGTGIQIQSRLSGADFSIGENGGSTATELGIRTFSSSTTLDSLNHGLGVHSLAQQNAGGNDFSVQLEDGTTLQFQLTNESTVGDVINLINSAPGNGGKLTAQLASEGNGIELVSNVTGSAPFQVQQENNSQAAQDLGLIPAGQSTSDPAVAGSGIETITGSDVNPSETDSIFNALARLRDALRGNDQTGLDRAVSLIDSSSQQLDFTQASVGARQQALETLQNRLDSDTTSLQLALSNDIDVDLPTAITNLTEQQAAFQASLQVAGQLFKLSLLDYL
ncbi:MAG TPA: flagellin, partial [Pirellulales bacterium]